MYETVRRRLQPARRGDLQVSIAFRLLGEAMSKDNVGNNTAIDAFLRHDGRSRFAEPKPVSNRLFEWTAGILWLMAVAVATMALFAL